MAQCLNMRRLRSALAGSVAGLSENGDFAGMVMPRRTVCLYAGGFDHLALQPRAC